jgi:DNA-binding response OmpR family regulator
MSGQQKRVLIIEDDRFLRRACHASLQQQGFAVTTAEDGEAGLSAVVRERPDIVLLDLLMPKLSGLEVLRAVKADTATRAIPVVILSNSSRTEDREEVMALGAVSYLVKSNLSLKELGAYITQVLES